MKAYHLRPRKSKWGVSVALTSRPVEPVCRLNFSAIFCHSSVPTWSTLRSNQSSTSSNFNYGMYVQYILLHSNYNFNHYENMLDISQGTYLHLLATYLSKRYILLSFAIIMLMESLYTWKYPK